MTDETKTQDETETMAELRVVLELEAARQLGALRQKQIRENWPRLAVSGPLRLK